MDKETVLKIRQELSNVNLLVCTPCYAGQCFTGYLRSTVGLVQLLTQLGIEHEIDTLDSESLITRGRNAMTARFIGDEKFTHMMFIDSDITYNPQTVLRLLLSKQQVCGACYPKKVLNWDKIRMNIKKDTEKGLSNDELLAKSLDYVVNVVAEGSEDVKSVNIKNGFIKVSNLGTGFMLIERSVIDIMIAKYPEQKYENDIEGYSNPLTDGNFYLFFDTMVHPESKRYLSEDYAFCQKWMDCGGEIYMDIFSPLVHTGWFNYKGFVIKSLEDSIVAPPENKVIEEKENIKNIEESNSERKSVNFSDMKI
jgi:hypothetical protein